MDYGVIGKRLPRVDSRIKATGEARFTVDLTLPKMLYGKIFHSPYPHARIHSIDTSRTERLSGVKAIVTFKDTIGKKFGMELPGVPRMLDEYPLAKDKVRYVGDEILAVAAVDEDIAEEALDLVRIEWELLTPLFDPLEAMKHDAPRIHEEGDNVVVKIVRSYGDVENAFKEAYLIREDTFKATNMAHCTLEPNAALAHFHSDGRLTLWSTTQKPFDVKDILAGALGLAANNVRVIQPHLGGGFGGRVEMMKPDFCSSLLSIKTGLPVKIIYTREEVFTSTRQRHAMTITLKTGVKKDGTLLAKSCTNIMDNGAYNSRGPIILAGNWTDLYLLYKVPNLCYTGFLVYTNKTPGGALRGFGRSQIRFADDLQMEMIAKDLDIDPVEIRLKNAVHTGDITPENFMIPSCGFSQCLEDVVKASSFQEKVGKEKKNKGIGLAGTVYVSGVRDFTAPYDSGATLEVHPDGTVTLFSGASDIGQGSNTALSMICAEELGVKLEDVRLYSADTDITPRDSGAFASKITLFSGNAVKAAASDAKRQILEVASEILEASIEDLEAKNRRIYVKGSPEKGMDIKEVIKAYYFRRKGPIFGRGFFTPEMGRPDLKRGGITPTYSFGAQSAEIEVDPETGKVKVERVIVSHDIGFALNPLNVEGQMEGAVSMGMGYGLYENIYRDEGQMLNPSFLGYKIPTVLEMPEIISSTVETIDPIGPFGAKGFSEGVKVPTPPAIANAVYDSTGIRFKELPLIPEKIFEAIGDSVIQTLDLRLQTLDLPAEIARDYMGRCK